MSNEDDKPVTVNRWDANAVKHAVDDCVKQVILDRYGYFESHRLLDIRLAISIISVSFAGFALVWDWFNPFPTSRPVLIVCVLAYFALMSVLQLYTWYIEKGTFAVMIDRDVGGKRPDHQWMLSSKMKKYDHIYQLELRFFGAGGEQQREANLEKSITGWIDTEGNVLHDILKMDVLTLHASLSEARKNN
jgi:signal peptidase complex subunit 2